MPLHASQMYSRNMETLLVHLIEDGELKLDFDDEIIADASSRTAARSTSRLPAGGDRVNESRSSS